MATILNDRDVLIQATVPRASSATSRAMILSVDSPVFHVDTALVGSPSSVTVTATLINMVGTVTWSTSMGSIISSTATTATLAYANMGVDLEVIQASLTVDGVTYLGSVIINKIHDGATGATPGRTPVQLAASGYSSWSDSAADAVLVAAGYGTPINRDVVTLYDATHSTTKFYDSGTWLTLDAYIPGNLLVTGTVSADVLSGGTINGIIVRFGTGHTIGGYAFEITSSGVIWVDNLFGGILNADNFYTTTASGVTGVSSNNSAKAGIQGIVSALDNSNASAVGVKGGNYWYGTEGSIGTATGYDFYASGSGTNYGPFTGAHDVLLQDLADADVGDIVIDIECIERNGLSNTIFKVQRSSEPNQKSALGVLVLKLGKLSNYAPAVFIESTTVGIDPVRNSTMTRIMTPKYAEVKDSYYLGAANALGEGQVNVCGEAGDIQKGDLIVTSSTPGKGMKQSDDTVRSYTVCRARENCSFSDPSEIKQIACIYLCG